MTKSPLGTPSVYSALTLMALMLVLGWTTLRRPAEGTLNWDVTGYYFYLPALFIYNDIGLEDRSWMEEMRGKYDLSGTLYQFHAVEGSAANVDQYTSGMAFMYAPAFAVAHAMAPSLGYPQDGFSWPYQTAIAWWSVFIAMAGLVLLRKLLLFFFPDWLAALVLVMIVFGTNYFIQVPRGLATPHNYLFLLHAACLIATIRWHEVRSRGWLIVLSSVIGLASLIRPTEVLLIFIPLLWEVRNWRDVRAKVRNLWSHERRNLIMGGLILIACASPQIIYWSVVTGRPLYNSYANPAEGLDLLSPHTLDFLFSFRKGWFIYTPLMLISLYGFVVLWKYHRTWFWSLMVFFVLNLYIISSWSNWWYAQCFSQRAMVQSLPEMAILLGFAVLGFRSLRILKWAGYAALVLAFFITVFFQWQYEHYILHADRMTRDYFFAVLGKTEVSDADRELLLVSRSFYGETVFSEEEKYVETASYRYANEHRDKLQEELLPVPVLASKVTSESPFSAAIKRQFREYTHSDHFWAKARAIVWLPEGTAVDDLLFVGTADHKGKVYGYHAQAVNPDSIRYNDWNTIHFDYLSPEVRRKTDPIGFYLWYRGNDTVYFQDFQVRVFERLPPQKE